jgi:hypothetical protein
MSRRIALALSFSLTIVVTFAVVSFASQAGWLEAKSNGDDETAVVEPEPSPTAELTVQQEPRVITEYVYVDVPAGAPPAAPQATAPPATPTPQPTVAPQQGNNNTGPAVAVQPRQSAPPTQAAKPKLPANPTQPPSTSGPSGRGAEPEDDEDEHEEEHEHKEHEEHEDDD